VDLPARRHCRGSRESWSHCTWSASTRSVPSSPNSPDPAVVAGKTSPTQPCSPPVPPTWALAVLFCHRTRLPGKGEEKQVELVS
jgi:hypothetical protein